MVNLAFVKIDKDLPNWQWFNKDHMLQFWIYLLCKATYKECCVGGVELKKGQVIIGRKKIAEKLEISEQNVKTYIRRLKNSGEITTKSTNKYTIVTIVKWEDYQVIPQIINQQTNHQINQQLTNNQPRTNQQSTTIKEIKEQKEVKESFIKDIESPISPFPDVEKYLDEKTSEVNDFYTTPLFDIFESEFARPLSQKEVCMISQWASEYEDKLIRYALREALVYDKRDINYIDRILWNWKERNFTCGQYEEGKR